VDHNVAYHVKVLHISRRYYDVEIKYNITSSRWCEKNYTEERATFMAGNHRRACSRGSTNVIVIVTILAIVSVVGMIIRSYLVHKKISDVQKNYAPCYQNLCYIEKALIAYGRDHKGLYPKTLKELTPKYIKAIPTCPQAGKDTYSPSYLAITNRPMFFVACEGRHHLGPPDTPQTFSDPAYLTGNADNPMTIVYENGNMKEIMKLLQKSNELMKKGNYKEALEVHRSLLKIQKARRDQVYVKMARCHFHLGDDRRALDALSDAVDSHFDLQEWLTMKQFISRDDNRDQVLKILRKHHKNMPDDIGAALMLTRFLEESGKEGEARKIYEQSLESGAAGEVGPVAELYFSGQLLRLEGKQDEALSTLLGIREVQTENMPAENYICTLAEEQIRKMKKGEGTTEKPSSPAITRTPDANNDEKPSRSPGNGQEKTE